MLAVLSICPAPPLASAQDTTGEARALFEQGVRLAAEGRLWEAVVAFERSDTLVPRASTLFNLAMVLDGLERGPECVAVIARYLALGDAGDAANRRRLETLRDSWLARLGTLVMRLEPADARVTLDGAPVPAMSSEGADRTLTLMPGTHRLRVEREGHVPWEGSVEVRARARLERRVVLAPHAGGLGVQLRAIDAATVRVVSLLGIDAEPLEGLPMFVARPRVGHGSGVTIDETGLVVTAGHVVDASILTLVFPALSHEAVRAEVRAARERPDVAVLATLREQAPALALGPRLEGIVLGARVSASGFPLEVGERVPAAASGEIARVREDGRLQLSMSLNPGSSGGPVVDARGQLLGVVSQGADPSAGAQGIVIVEPVDQIAPIVAEARALVGPHSGASGAITSAVPDAVSEALLVLVGARAPTDPLTSASPLDRLAGASPVERALVVAATWNALVDATRARRALHWAALGPPDAERASEIEAQLRTEAATILREVPSFASRLPFLSNLASGQDLAGGVAGGVTASRHVSTQAWASCADACPRGCDAQGECRQLSRWEGLLMTGLSFSDREQLTPGLGVEQRREIDFGTFTIAVTRRVLSFGSRPARLSLVVGGEGTLGRWRSMFVGSLAADVGLALDLGGERVALTVRGLYTPGVIWAEGRTHALYRAYRAALGLTFQRQSGYLGFGVSWREAGRASDSTFRALELYLEIGR